MNISQDREPSLSITGEENLLAIIETTCEDGRLVIQSGNVDRLKGSASGASSLNAEKVAISKADVKASGASQITVRVLDEFKANASGASNVIYSGSPEVVKKDTGGSSSISKSKE